MLSACRWAGEDNPLAFKPERWLTPAGQKPGAWIPFGGGARYVYLPACHVTK